MGIIRPQKVKVKWNPSNKKYYEELGYTYTKMGEEFIVRIEDLPINSKVEVVCCCDSCSKELKWKYQSYNKYVKEEGKTYCRKCAMKLYGIEHYRKSRSNNIKKSFAQWLIEEYGDNALELYWDYNKNTLDPWKISYRTSRIKIWIKCQEKDYHGSYEINCANFSSGHRCPYCSNRKIHPLDSLKQSIINEYGEDFFDLIWNNKNAIDPTTIAPNSIIDCWWNCIDNKHEPYQRNCYNSKRSGYRCPKCVKERDESLIEEKVRLYLEELGYKVLTEHECSIKLTNPKTGRPLPFDNEIILENNKHLIIEVHGGQHYDYHFYMTKKKITKEEAEKELHYQQVKDRYKRIICKKAGYEYLEIPYNSIKDSDRYKILIKDKIKEIISKKYK